MAKKTIGLTIGVVARTYGVHQQTLRLYEREGLLTPRRSKGNTRLYTEEDLVRLETILTLTRDLGINLAGVGIILDLLTKFEALQMEFEQYLAAIRSHVSEHLDAEEVDLSTALVPRRFPTIVASRPPDRE